MRSIMSNNGENPVLLSKPRMQVAIEHLDQAHGHMSQVSRVLSSMILDLEKATDFISRFRDSMIKSLDEVGGDVQGSIETQIKDYLPPKYKEPNAA